MAKLDKHKITIISLVILALGVAGYFIWKNTNTTNFKGKEEILDETLVTLKEGEFIKSKEVKENYFNYSYYFKNEKIGSSWDGINYINQNKFNSIENPSSIFALNKVTNKNNYIYEFDFNKNTFTKKIKTKPYIVTNFETNGDQYFISYLQSRKIKEEVFLYEGEVPYEQLFTKGFSSQLTNPILNKSLTLKNQYIYGLLYENEKLYVFLSKDYSNEHRMDLAEIESDFPEKVYVYDKNLNKIDEIKKDKDEFIKKKTFNLKQLNFPSGGIVIEKDGYKIEYIHTYLLKSEKDDQGYKTELNQYKDGEKIKSLSIEPEIYDFNFTTPLVYQPKGYLILRSDTPSGFIKINVETLEYEDCPIKGLDSANDKTK